MDWSVTSANPPWVHSTQMIHLCNTRGALGIVAMRRKRLLALPDRAATLWNFPRLALSDI